MSHQNNFNVTYQCLQIPTLINECKMQAKGSRIYVQGIKKDPGKSVHSQHVRTFRFTGSHSSNRIPLPLGTHWPLFLRKTVGTELEEQLPWPWKQMDARFGLQITSLMYRGK